MNILIDNQDIKDVFGVQVLDWTPALNFAAERKNERTWVDKSGVDKNLVNARYEAKEFVFKCIVIADNYTQAYNNINTLVEYMYNKRVVVLSLRDENTRLCFPVERSKTITGDANIRQQDSLYIFKLGFKDINPNAVKYYNTIIGNETTIDYTKGQKAVIYWGDGTKGLVSNSGLYTKSDYIVSSGDVDVVIDIDKDNEDIDSLTSDFTADVTSGVASQDVNFTDTSTGTPAVWSWSFGDGTTSSEQNPSHTYTSAGTYTVTLQIFNDAKGSDVETKTNYITIRNARRIINDSGNFALINDSDFALQNGD